MTVEELSLTLDDFVRLPSWQFAELWRLLGEAIYAKAHRPTEQEVEQPANAPAGAPSAVSPEGYELGAGHAEWLHGVGHGALDIEPEPAPPVTSKTIAPEPYPFACDRRGHEAAGPKSLESHEATCRVPFGSFVCPFCKRSDFGTPQALGAHKRYKHAQGVAS